jgi:hypothetical protein
VKPVHLCIPVLKRYDLLHTLIASLDNSTVQPLFYIVDNGRDAERLHASMSGRSYVVHRPDEPLGLASAWNWFIENTPEERLLANDDVTFVADSIERMIDLEGDFVSALPGSNAFSCFLLRDSCVEKVGLFDETISPGYAYYEDCDYVNRMILKGIPITGMLCGVEHAGSQTTAQYSPQEWSSHHEKFLTAQNNFVKKWGRLPDEAAAKAEYEATLR